MGRGRPAGPMKGRDMMKCKAMARLISAAAALSFSACNAEAPTCDWDGDAGVAGDPWYPIVDTQQTSCYDNSTEIACPAAGEVFFGQDAQLSGAQPSYTRSGDGLSVHDNVTGLTWQQSYEASQYWDDAHCICAALNTPGYGGYTDWRLPTIKELYSLWNASDGLALHRCQLSSPTIQSVDLSTASCGAAPSTPDCSRAPKTRRPAQRWPSV
ncbi:MAG: DUF1566 domain-containing protein [Candidatus Moduliflexus flocculans]|nr:DUF1566 domain-containing protein [Candidatus Moduliflexus flocculans]